MDRVSRRQDARERTCVRRANVLADSFGRAFVLEREMGRPIGAMSRSKGCIAAQRLELNRVLSFSARLPGFVRPQFDEPNHNDHITSFVRDEPTGNMFGGVSVGGSSGCLLSVHAPTPFALYLQLITDRVDLGQLNTEMMPRYSTQYVLPD